MQQEGGGEREGRKRMERERGKGGKGEMHTDLILRGRDGGESLLVVSGKNCLNSDKRSR